MNHEGRLRGNHEALEDFFLRRADLKVGPYVSLQVITYQIEI